MTVELIAIRGRGAPSHLAVPLEVEKKKGSTATMLQVVKS